jgi:hypothetical protein
VFFGARDLTGTDEGRLIDETCVYLLGKMPSELVALTHWQGGAWAKHYVPGIRGIVIPDRDIIAEYDARLAAA